MKVSNEMLNELIARWDNEALFEADTSKCETLRACADTLRMLIELKPPLEVWEDPQYSPCPACNSNGVFKYSPHKDCICDGKAYMIKLG